MFACVFVRVFIELRDRLDQSTLHALKNKINKSYFKKIGVQKPSKRVKRREYCANLTSEWLNYTLKDLLLWNVLRMPISRWNDRMKRLPLTQEKKNF